MEGVFNIKDFIIQILRKWRLMLIMGLCFGILLGGVKYCQGLGELKEEKKDTAKAYERRIKNLEKELEFTEKKQQLVEDHIAESILMNSEPRFGRAYSMSIRLKSKEESAAAVLAVQNSAQIYADYINSGRIYELFHDNKEVSKNSVDLSELIYASSNGNLLTIEGYLVDELNVQEMIDELYKVISENADIAGVTQDYYDFEIVYSGEGEISSFLSTALSKKQDEFGTLVDKYRSSVDTKKTRLETLISESGYSVVTKQTVMKDAIKFTIVGIILGIVFGALFGLVLALFSNTLKKKEEIEALGITCIANMNTGKKGMFIDRWIDKLEGTKQCSISENQKADYIAESIHTHLQKQSEKKHIVFVSSAASKVEEILLQVEKVLEEKSYEVSVCGDVTTNSKAIGQVANSDVVILMEAGDISNIVEIENECQIVRNLEKEILGFVMV